MIHGLLADLVLVAHAAFVLFVIFGGLLALRWRRAAWVHVPCALWGAWVELAGWVCPLTPLEVSFRIQAGEAGYPGGFLERYVTAALYPSGLTRQVQVGLGIAVLLFNGGVYLMALRRWRRSSGPSTARR